jgi:hypothetical protein
MKIVKFNETLKKLLGENYLYSAWAGGKVYSQTKGALNIVASVISKTRIYGVAILVPHGVTSKHLVFNFKNSHA